MSTPCCSSPASTLSACTKTSPPKEPQRAQPHGDEKRTMVPHRNCPIFSDRKPRRCVRRARRDRECPRGALSKPRLADLDCLRARQAAFQKLTSAASIHRQRHLLSHGFAGQLHRHDRAAVPTAELRRRLRLGDRSPSGAPSAHKVRSARIDTDTGCCWIAGCRPGSRRGPSTAVVATTRQSVAG